MFNYVKNYFSKQKSIANLLFTIDRKLSNIEKRIEEMAYDLSLLNEQVTRAVTVQASAVSLLNGITARLEEVQAELAKKNAEAPQPIDTSALDDFVSKLKSSTDSLATAVSDSSNVIPHQEVILNADNSSVPTVSVVMPEVVPEHVEVSAEKLADPVDPSSPEPQIVVTVKEDKAPEAPPSEPEVQDVLKTEENLVDVNLTAPAAVVEEMKSEGVDVIEAVKTAYESSPEVTAAPAE